MGDILEDALMACDSKHDTVLRVGFLNVREHPEFDNNFIKFQKEFDIVITDDGSLEPIVHLLDFLKDESGSDKGGKTI
jgi:hypothetical protein